MQGRVRFTVAFYLDKRRVRRTFGTLDAAKREARDAARKIQEGRGKTNDLRPEERDTYLAASQLLRDLDIPMFSAVEDYVKQRRRLGDVLLGSAVEEYLRRLRDVHRHSESSPRARRGPRNPWQWR